MPRSKVVPRIKTQENFEEQVKEELQSVSGNDSTSKLKKKRNKNTSLHDKSPTKPRPKKKVTPPPPPSHQTSISELNDIKFDMKDFAMAQLSESLTHGSNGRYISLILYRNMVDFLKREKFYLGNVSGPDKNKIKQALQKDFVYIKRLVKEM